MSDQSLRPGVRLSEYILVERIGSGGFGEVWVARHAEIEGRRVAIKVPTERGFTRELRAEAFLQSALVHPNIVRTLGLNTQHDPPFFVMEYVEGISLRDLLRKKRRLLPAQASRVVSQTLEALQFAHDRGVVHRDVKPGNIICGTDGRVRVTDFGLSHVSDLSASTMRHSGRGPAPRLLPGTALYMAPEQRRGQVVDGRADVYASGVVLFEALTGELPSGCDLPGELNPRVPPELDAIVKRALKSEAGLRYATAGAMREDLERFLRGEEPLAKPAGTFAARGSQRWLAVSAAATVAVAALGLAAPFVMNGRHRGGNEALVSGMAADPFGTAVPGAEAAAGRVVLRTVPEGADVFVDGRSVGVSPAAVDGLAAGRHVATFRLRDHAELAGEFSVGPGETLSPVWRLENLIGGLALTVTPSGARVTVDGKDYGTASPVLDLRNLPAGRHSIRVEAPDCRTWEADIDIAGGRVAERRVELARIGYGTLVLESDPPGARVFVEGKDAGAAGKPLTVERLREGQYRVTFVLEGYEPLDAEIDVTADDVTTHTAALVARSSSLDLTVPPGAPVFVNGEPRAAGSQRFVNLRPGTHRVRVCDVEKTVTVEPGKSRELAFTLAELGMVSIPAGEFAMGADGGYPDAVPARRVRLAAYAIDRTEVTVRQYRRFLGDVEAHGDGAWRHPDQPAGKSHLPPGWGAEGTMTEEFPVLGVDWFDAYAYARWAGKRLPTEAEWERAARGASGQVWPWGNEAPYAGASARANLGDRNGGTGGPRVVGSYPQGASAEGVLDMAGNAWEWCADWYANDAYLAGPADNPRGPSGGRARVVRGGSFGMHPYLVRSFDRAAGDAVADPKATVGFRCAADLK